ncbi:Uncharacterized protein AC501_4174 [Pseudomonas amygdali pv. lachrymans]|nr:Uncharacterized protein AC501_4174 [Pseudomonas amygdali pv. lachrymans]
MVQNLLHAVRTRIAAPNAGRCTGQQGVQRWRGHLDEAVDPDRFLGQLVSIVNVQGAAANHLSVEQRDVFPLLELLHFLDADFLLIFQAQCVCFLPAGPHDSGLTHHTAHHWQVLGTGHQLQYFESVLGVHDLAGDSDPHVPDQRPHLVASRRLEALRLLTGQEQAKPQGAYLRGQLAELFGVVGPDLVADPQERKAVLVLADHQDVFGFALQFLPKILAQDHGQLRHVQTPKGRGLGRGDFQRRNQDHQDAIVMHHVLEVYVAGVTGKHMAVGVIEQGQHAGELLDQKTMLIQRGGRPFLRRIHLGQVKTGQCAQVVFQG